MLLILGQPGIGKSTLITWITANFKNSLADILVYKFASDLKDINWNNGIASNKILEKLGLTLHDLNGKILIIDGFDELSIDSSQRRDILDNLYGDWIYNNNIDNFSLIITCRENYIPRFAVLKYTFITLRPWDKEQIESYCNVYQEKTKTEISKDTINVLIKNRAILGIPLLLYMVLALNISIDQEGSLVDITPAIKNQCFLIAIFLNILQFIMLKKTRYSFTVFL